MERYDVVLNLITMTKENAVLSRRDMPVTVLATSRNEAILAGLDVGQAISRSANCSGGEVGIFFRVTGLTKKDTI
jgi:hypothetical protein